MKPSTHESGCGRCIFFAVYHRGGVRGWTKVVVRFAWHRWSGECRRFRRLHRLLRELVDEGAPTGASRPGRGLN